MNAFVRAFVRACMRGIQKMLTYSRVCVCVCVCACVRACVRACVFATMAHVSTGILSLPAIPIALRVQMKITLLCLIIISCIYTVPLNHTVFSTHDGSFQLFSRRCL